MTCSLCWLNFFSYFLRGIYGPSLIEELLIYIIRFKDYKYIYIILSFFCCLYFKNCCFYSIYYDNTNF